MPAPRKSSSIATWCLGALIAAGAALPLAAQQADPPPEVLANTSTAAVTREVGPRDTLMSIAREWADANGVTIAQSMYGIYRANPQAFGPRGMNELLLGATLQMPDAAQMRSIRRREAIDAVSRELGIWAGAQTAAQSAASTPAPASPPAPAPVSAAQPVEMPAELQPEPTVAESAVVQPTVDERLERLETELLTRQRELEAKLAALERRPAVAADLLDLLKRWWLGLALAAVVVVLAVNLWRRARPSREESAPAPMPVPPVLTPVPAPTPAAAPVPIFKPPAAKAPAQDALDPDELEGDPPPIQDVTSMLHLARAYLEMGDKEAAARELRSVLELGDESQRSEAERLLADC